MLSYISGNSSNLQLNVVIRCHAVVMVAKYEVN